MSLITFSSDSRGGVRWVLLVKKHVDHQFEQKTAARLSVLLDKITTGDIDPTTGTFNATAGRHEVKFSKSFQCFTVCIFTCVHIPYTIPSSSKLDCLSHLCASSIPPHVSRGIFKHEFLQVNQSQYHFGGKANWMSPFPPDTCQRLGGISSPNSPARPAQASRLCPAGRRSQVNDFVFTIKQAL